MGARALAAFLVPLEGERLVGVSPFYLVRDPVKQMAHGVGVVSPHYR